MTTAPERPKVDTATIRAGIQDRLFPRVGYHPHPGQLRIHRSSARHRLASCGRRFGKSTVGGMELLTEAYLTELMLPALKRTGRRREFWICGPQYDDAAKEFRVVYNALHQLDAPFDRPGTYNNEKTGDMQISLYGGKFLVLGKSAAKPDRLVGEGLNGVIMAEAAKQKHTTWTRFIRPMLADFRGWSLHTSTPEGKNWFYDLWNVGQDTSVAGWESWRMPAWRNRHVYRTATDDAAVRRAQQLLRDRVAVPQDLLDLIDAEILDELQDLTPEAFNQEIAADFTDFVGRVFGEFDEDIHVKDFGWNPAWPTYAATDYGFTNPFVFLVIQVDPYDGATYVVDELYQSGLTIDEAAAEVQARDLVKPGMRDLYPDPASPGDTRVLEQRLRLVGRPDTGGEIKFRLRAIRSALKTRNLHLPEGHELRRPRLFVNRRCVNTVREMLDYRYPDTVAQRGSNPPEQPLKKDDHCPEALGRFFAGRFPDAPESGTRISQASFG